MRDLDSWLAKARTLLDSLNLIEPGSLPDSFVGDIIDPLKKDQKNLDGLAERHRFLDLMESLADLAVASENRNWYFWEQSGKLLAEFVRAEQACFFYSNGQGPLTKIHPLETEEETKDYQWPFADNTFFTRERTKEWPQSAFILLPGLNSPNLVLWLGTSRGFPRMQPELLVQPETRMRLLRRHFDPAMPSQDLGREIDITPKGDENGPLMGEDPTFLKALAAVEHAAQSEATVFLSGESGTGKELFARHLHNLSSRSAGPFIPINCSAIPHELIESEMFGHEKGAFTGAYYRKIGKVEQAHGGTLFLDEIGEMPLPFQAKLLRWLQERTFNRVGGNQTVRSDARVVVATHRDLKDMVRQKEFREDLYYRVNVIPIGIPPLRDRGGDIRCLAESFFRKYIEKSRASRRKVDEAVFDCLDRYTFPGNVRELDNIIQRTVVMTQKRVIQVEDLPDEVRQAGMAGDTPAFQLHPFEKFDFETPVDRDTLRRLKKEVERTAMSYERDLDRRFLMHLLRCHDFSARKAAEAAEINRTLFYKLLKRAGIDINYLGKGDS